MNDGRRTYVMRTRAEAAEQTKERILLAVMALVEQRPIAALVLTDVAAEAQVSVQTVLRHFATRDGLLDAATAYGRDVITAERVPPPGDIADALEVLFDHYEMRGNVSLMLLAQESWDARARMITDNGKRIHRDWVIDVFGEEIDDRSPAERDELIDLLVVATDVYCWKLLRRDRRLDRPAAQRRVRRMIDALLER